MSKSKEYKAIKNYIHNDLKLSREVLIDIVKEEVRDIAIKVIKNTYGTNDIESVVKQVLRHEIIGNKSDVGWAFQEEITKMMKAIVQSEFEVKVEHKQTTKKVMKEENYKRACEIKQELSVLKSHKADLEKARFSETRGGLTFWFNNHYPEVRLMPEIVPPDFKGVYSGLLDAAIQDLEKEFENL